ncbi:MAG: hypothetical protein AAFX87_31250 [Bacteroidota bacterium]
MDTEITYTSHFNGCFFLLPLFIIPLSGFVSAFLLHDTSFYWGYFVPTLETLVALPFLGLFIITIIPTLMIKTIKTNKEQLIVRYIFLGITVRTNWDDIDKAKLTYGSTGEDSRVSDEDRKLVLFKGRSRFTFYSYMYYNFNNFRVELDKRLSSQVKEEMRINFKKHRKKLFG